MFRKKKKFEEPEAVENLEGEPETAGDLETEPEETHKSLLDEWEDDEEAFASE